MNKETRTAAKKPGGGLIDMPKLDESRKEEIRAGILTEIRSWKRMPDARPEPIARKQRGFAAGAALGAGGVLLIVLVLVLARPLWLGNALDPAGSSVPVQGGPEQTAVPPVPPEIPSEIPPEIPSESLPGASDDPDLPAAGHRLPTTDPAYEPPQGVADTVMGLTYDEFLERWEAGAAGEAEPRLSLYESSAELKNSLPGLNETRQGFGKLGNSYTAWTNYDDNQLRELSFSLGTFIEGQPQAKPEVEVVRYLTTVLQPDLTDAQRDALLADLGLPELQGEQYSMEHIGGGLRYTAMHGDDRLFLVVEFLRKGQNEDELGKWQDSLLDTVR
ncbi:hypothetical protein [Saccharibacillus alkalitolerans]|uniref:Uncharacterized protein n=1 Tax=Saccharibacillus alkalitolerans TaxID=2705290 RepID=A0ABX0FAH6_9BACL|nr:hypothetical protein [Saccharibacillus alkalitolerans]NGZ77946.1 hypothetical protein [Saccharibacillus alkalitolerans]